MAHDDKPLKLRPVEEGERPAPVVRIGNRETDKQGPKDEPVRLEVRKSVEEPNYRLDVPDKDSGELRTHQPGIEALIENEVLNADILEQSWAEAATSGNSIPWGWFALVALALVAAVCWSLLHWHKAEIHTKDAHKNSTRKLLVENQEQLKAQIMIDQIDHALRTFFNTSSVELLSYQVRHRERVFPLMQTFYAGKPLAPGELRSISSLQPLTMDNHGNFWIATVRLLDGTTRSIILEIIEHGSPLIDWETYVCHQPMKWDKFVSDRPSGESLDFRVYAEKDNFFSHEFGDSSLWACFRLQAMGSSEALYGYARIGSDEAKILQQLIEQSKGGKVSVILRLAIPAAINSQKGVVIEKVLNSRWIYLDSPSSDL
ncbi:MAG: hypothetical protein H8M99_07410 [Gloeobacteraceae cyanobacterium ES-bin-144]|nr:hypothetical protein [Verrucomicrobiales bacterium]